jgi:hypothetical protein
MTSAPQECTLPTAEQPLRLAEFDALFAGLISLDRLGPSHVRMHLAGPADLADIVRDLTARESECCSFFTFAATSVPGASDGRVTLDIEVPLAYAAVVEALAERAEAVAAQGKASDAQQ